MKICILLLAAMLLSAAVTNPGYVPTSDTAVVTSTVTLQYMHLNNKSGSSASCVVKDQSTNCGGGACSLWGPAPVAASGSAGSIVSWPFGSLPAPGGIKWSCDVANAVVGSIQYK